MSGHIKDIKPLERSLCAYWPGEKVEAQCVRMMGANEDIVAHVESPMRRTKMLRDARFEGVDKGYVSKGFSAVAPLCPSCRACIPLRVNIDKFSLSASQRKMIARDPFVYDWVPSKSIRLSEMYTLFLIYTNARHTGTSSSMHKWGIMEFDQWLEDVPFALTMRDQEKWLAGFAAMDAEATRVIMEYSVFHPDYEDESPGKRLWLNTMLKAREFGVKHVYVGSYAKGSPKLDYKRHYRGLETFDGEKWVDFDPAIHVEGPDYGAMIRREGFQIPVNDCF